MRHVFYSTTEKSCSKVILPVPGFYELYTTPVESDPLWSWSDRRPQTTSPPWKRGERKNNDWISLLAEVVGFTVYQLSVLLQGSVNILSCSLHEGVADGGARDGDLLRDGRERRAESLSSWAGHRTQLTAQGHHGVHNHLDTNDTRYASPHAYSHTLMFPKHQLFMHSIFFICSLRSSPSTLTCCHLLFMRMAEIESPSDISYHLITPSSRN